MHIAGGQLSRRNLPKMSGAPEDPVFTGAPHTAATRLPSSSISSLSVLRAQMDGEAQYTVLRIKRKATEAPLSSLGEPQSYPGAILPRQADTRFK